MASMKMLIILAIIAVVSPPALAKEFIVGDDAGWTINFDYQAWAQGKDFRVGDKIVFKYPKGAHNIFRVDGTAFQQCAAPAASEALATGNDVFTLGTPGTKWYICGVGKHCESGNQKLVITVLPESESPASSPSVSGTPTPSENPESAATGFTASTFYVLISAAFSIFIMIMV